MTSKYIHFFIALFFLLGIIVLEVMIKAMLGSAYHNFFINPLIRGLCFAVGLLIYVKYKELGKKEIIPIKKVSGQLKSALFFFIVSLYLVIFLLVELESYFKLGLSEYLDTFNNNRALTGNVLKVLLIGPIFEELFFRGVILTTFLKIYNKKNAIALSSLLFALAHVELHIDHVFANIISAFSLGFFLAWVFTKTFNIRLIIVVHFFWNILNYLTGIFLVMFDIYLYNILDFLKFSGAIVVISLILFIVGNKFYKSLSY